MEEKALAGDFTQGSIANKLIRFMIPILGALVLQAMYGAVDLLVVGQFGTDAGISAVSTGSNVINLVTFVISELTMGVTVLIGRYLGENRHERIGKVIGGAIVFFAIMAAALMILLLAFAPQFASWLNAPKEAYDLTVTYIRICGAGILFVVAYNVISGIFRGLGNSRLPLIFVAIACVVNIVGDLVFVAVFKMNVAGAALATILAQLVSVVMSLAIIKKQQFPFHFSKKDICFSSEIRNFLKVGFPIALQEFLTNISFLILCAIINGMGLEAFFRLWNCTEGSIVYHADPILTDAVHVSFCGTECRSRKRGTGKKSNAYRNVVRSHDRNLCIGTQFFQRRYSIRTLYRKSGIHSKIGRVSERICTGSDPDLSGIQLHRVF